MMITSTVPSHTTNGALTNEPPILNTFCVGKLQVIGSSTNPTTLPSSSAAPQPLQLPPLQLPPSSLIVPPASSLPPTAHLPMPQPPSSNPPKEIETVSVLYGKNDLLQVQRYLKGRGKVYEKAKDAANMLKRASDLLFNLQKDIAVLDSLIPKIVQGCTDNEDEIDGAEGDSDESEKEKDGENENENDGENDNENVLTEDEVPEQKKANVRPGKTGGKQTGKRGRPKSDPKERTCPECDHEFDTPYVSSVFVRV